MHNVKVVTFGCRINTFESEFIKKRLEDSTDNHQYIVVNTCAVTAEAERQCRQNIRKLRKENPNARIIVAGCAAQVNGKKFAEMPEVDLVLGNKEKMELEKYIEALNSGDKLNVSDIMAQEDLPLHLVQSFEGMSKAFIEIQQGCDHRCTYCIIPYARGKNRSIKPDEIITQAQTLIDNGYKEITLTGIDIASYGHGLDDEKLSLSQLLELMITKLPNLPRLRLSSLDPMGVDELMLDLFKSEPRLMPHVHLSIQNGDNMVLKRMKRRHDRERVIDICDKFRSIRSDFAIGSDFICGFPTETDEMFANTLDLVERCQISHLHVFPYSERAGTPASLMPPVDKQIRKARSAELRTKGEEVLNKFLQKQVGTVRTILSEKENGGHSDNYLWVETTSAIKPDEIIKTKIIAVKEGKLIGEVI